MIAARDRRKSAILPVVQATRATRHRSQITGFCFFSKPAQQWLEWVRGVDRCSAAAAAAVAAAAAAAAVALKSSDDEEESLPRFGGEDEKEGAGTLLLF